MTRASSSPTKWKRGVAPLFAQIYRMGLEGIVAKKRDARYAEGRSTSWLKVARFDIGTRTVIGFATKASARHAAAIILAEDMDGPRPVGRVGSGLTNDRARDLSETLSAQETAEPANPVPKIVDARWIAPGPLTPEVSFRGRSPKGMWKQPAVIGLSVAPARPKAKRHRLVTGRDLAKLQLTNPAREIFKG